MKTLLLTLAVAVLLLFLGVVAMGMKALFVKGGRFPNGHACSFDKNRAAKKVKQTTPN